MISDNDPLIPHEDWWLPQTETTLTIPRNFKLATELHRNLNKSPHLEFVFYDFTINEVLVVEPIEILSLVQVTVESEDRTRYLTSAIDIESWTALKPNLIYLGLV